jgi:hypothetical protein
VKAFFHCYFVDVIKYGERLEGVIIATKQGLRSIHATIVVDASGDADVIARAGAPFEDAGALGIAQSLTTTFKVINVDAEKAKAFPKHELWALMEPLQGYDLPRKEGSAHITPFAGVMVTNMTRVAGVDATDPSALSRAEIEGRRQALEYMRFLKDKVPGYEKAELGGLSVHIGVRETRRIKGEYWLIREDVLFARKFSDAIAKCAAPIEEHHAGGDTKWEYLPEGEAVDIPLRALLPQRLDNVIVAGRCLSASHEAHAALRSMGQCLAMGQAAGLAAAMTKNNMRDVDISDLRSRLVEMGAVL